MMDRPARVLMTADAVGGVWDYALELAGGLAELGIATTLAVMGPAPDAARLAAAARVPLLNAVHAPFRLEWMADSEADLDGASAWLLDLERRVRPDLVHINGYAQAALPFRAPVLCVGHSCVLSWWRAVHGCDAPAADWSRYADRVAAGLRAAGLVVAPTAAMLDTLHDLYGPLPRVRTIHNGRSAGAFRPGPKRPYVLSAGRVWDEAKNIAALDAAAPHVSWPIVVAGDIAGPDGAPRPPRHLDHRGRLAPAEMARHLGTAAVFALPARYEPFGLAVLEAALSGCALVLGDIPTLRELWDGSALFVPPDDRAALIRALQDLAGDGERVRALAEQSSRRAGAYTAERMTSAYLDAYGTLLRNRAAVAGG